MKTIKFRAWDFNSKSWYVPTEYGVSEGARNFFAVDKEIIEFNRGDMELMQFTGLFDKNGKEIYEGDIVKEFRTKSAPMANNGIDRKFTVEDIRDLDFSPNQCTIIGNIYENPELIKPLLI